MIRFKEELALVPERPGVYIMHDKDDGVLYVGKAVVLRNRLSSYFRNIPHSDRITVMISKIARFEYIVCDTEYEAFLLENNLIKKYKPKYNVLLKDDKGYPYIKVTVNEPYPRVMLARKVEKDGAKYFGPYFSGYTVNKTLEAVQSVLPLRTCKKKLNLNVSDNKDRPCLNYHMGLCRGACAGKISSEDYKILVDCVLDFLSGRRESLEQKLRTYMKEASDNLEFELAATYRDHLNALSALQEKQKISMLSENDFDVISSSHNEVDACTEVFFVRGGKVLGREYFMFEGMADVPEEELFRSFTEQFYTENQYVPPHIYLSTLPEDALLIEKRLTELRGHKCELSVPQKGSKKQLCDMARENAVIALSGGKNDFRVTLERISEIFGLEKVPERIESYDISNQGDSEINGSMVVFVNGKADKSGYRLFKMKRVERRSDTDSMEEMLERRYTRLQNGSSGFEIKPDLILMDGGLGQVHAAVNVLSKLDINIPVLGMVKDDSHRSRDLVSADGVIFRLRDDPGIWRFITAVQNETHRTAVSYNRRLTEKRYSKTGLDDIPGVGDKRKILLLKKFGSVKAIKEAALDEICAVPGIGKKCGESVYGFFHKDESES